MQIALIGKNRMLAVVLAVTIALNAVLYVNLSGTPMLSPVRPDGLYSFLDNLPRIFTANWTADNTSLRKSGVGAVSGDVVVKNKSTGGYVPLTIDYSPSQGDTIVSSSDSCAFLTLDTDKEIFIDANTVLELADVKIDSSTNGYVTRLMLHEGNVLSSVSKPLEEHDIYEVRTPVLDMAIRGTIVHVGYDKAAGSSMVAFLTGRGLVKSNDTGEVVALVAGEQIMQDADGYVKGNVDRNLLPDYIASSLSKFDELMYNIETVDFSNAYPDDGFNAEEYTFEQQVSAEDEPPVVPETTFVYPTQIDNTTNSTNGGGTQGGSEENGELTYTVTYNLYDDAQQIDSYTYGQGLTLPTGFTKVGYVFKGWFDNQELKGEPVTAISATDSGNKTFWAKWAKKTVTVGNQSETLTTGTGGRVTYTVTTENIESGTAIALNGIDSVDGASFYAATTIGDSTTITIETSNNTPAGTSPLTLTIDGVTSEQFNLIVSQKIPVTGITVTGEGGATQITTRNGTLQMFAAVSPGEATNPSVIWSVEQEGRAEISSSGLLTAKANGSVTVRATAVDGSGVFGELQINITGNFIAVSSVIIEPKPATIGTPLDLSSMVTIGPDYATNQTIEWSFHQNTLSAISNGNVIAAINNGMLTVEKVGSNGKVSVIATIKDAYGINQHYSSGNFDIAVNPAPPATQPRGIPNEVIIVCNDCGKTECICVCANCGELKDECTCESVCDVCGEDECICESACDVCGEVECTCESACDVCGEVECTCESVCDVCGEVECICESACDVCGETECVCVYCTVCGRREDECDGTCGTS